MTDVVEIARNRRSRLAAEIARLDDFIRLAEILIKYGDGPDRGTGGRPDDVGPITPLSDIEAQSENGRGPDAAPGGSTAMPTAKTEFTAKYSADLGAAVVKATDAPAEANTNREESSEDADHFQFSAQGRSDDEELVLTDDMSLEDAKADAIAGQKLRHRRWMMGLTKKQLANRAGIDADEIQKYERGETSIGMSRLGYLSAALEVPVSYFFETSEDQSVETGEARTDSVADRKSFQPVRERFLARTA